jgi:hypothetical protein
MYLGVIRFSLVLQKGGAKRGRQRARARSPAAGASAPPCASPWHCGLQTKQLLRCCCPLAAEVNGQRSPAQLPARRSLSDRIKRGDRRERAGKSFSTATWVGKIPLRIRDLRCATRHKAHSLVERENRLRSIDECVSPASLDLKGVGSGFWGLGPSAPAAWWVPRAALN